LKWYVAEHGLYRIETPSERVAWQTVPIRLVHLWIARIAIILSRTWGNDQLCVDRLIAPAQESAGLEDCIDFGQYDLGQVKLFEEILKQQSRRFVW